jgi:ribonuclease E
VTRRMLINAQRPEEVRIAIVTDGVLDQFEIAATESGLCRGNIYRGIVANVQPSLDAAFVNFGVEKDGLLRADDVVAEAYHKKPDGGGRHPRIDRILERGRPVLVQVVRDGVGHKGALVTTNISIAGRYLVLMPFDDVRGVSRKAEDDDRQAVKDRVAKLELPEGCGVILRTNALDQPQKTLNRDLSALLRLWKKIRDEAGAGKGPRLLYSDQDLIVQALRDSLDSSISEILVDDTEAFDKAQSYMRTFMPRSGSRLIHYTDRMPLFSRYELEEQIDRIYQRQIGLPSGGSIVIDGTEALTAIDVNSGRATRGANQEETAYKTNLEAAREVARQLRLRDIGGLMVVDFIDMRSSKHQRAVEKTMRDAMKDDKARSSVGRLSDNGLLEINRQRLKKALQLRTYRPCPTCSGTGSIASPELVALNILRRIETRAVTGQLGGVRVELHPELADAIQNHRRQELAALEREFDIEVEIIAAAGLHRAEERIEWRPRAKTEPRPTAPAVSAADIGEAFGRQAQPPDAEEPEVREVRATKDPDAVNDTAPDKPKPRRRRRGGRKRKKSTGGEDGPATDGAADDGEPHPPEQAATAADEDHEAAAAPGNGDDEAALPVKKKRRRPRRSRKKSPHTGDPTPSNESSEPSPPEPIQEEPDEPDPFSY